MDSNADQKKLEHYKDEFRRWIITCGLRELIETFAVFLDHIHSACLTMSLYKKTVSPKEAARSQKAFSRMGLKEKLQHLETAFNIKTAFNDYLFTINQVRNCLAHRRGIVGVLDCNNQQELTINWQKFFIFGESPDGKVVSLDLPIPKEGILFKDGAAIKLSIKESAKSFPIGARIELTPKELHEICIIIFRATADICTTAVDYAKLIAIPVRYVDK